MERIDDIQGLYDDAKELGQILYRMAKQSGMTISVYAHPKEEDEESGDFLHVSVGTEYRYREADDDED